MEAIAPADLVLQLRTSVPAEHWNAFNALMALGNDAVPAVLTGLSDLDWRVRRSCALFADHHPAPEFLDRLRLTARDPKAKVRLFAIHSLACEPCKPGGNPVDAVPILIRALKTDRALRVRRHAANMLWQQPLEQRIVRAFRWSIEHETDARLLRIANDWLQRNGVDPVPAATATARFASE